MRGVNFLAAKLERENLAEFVRAVPETGAIAKDIDAPKPKQGALQWMAYHGIIRRLSSVPKSGYRTVWGRGEYWYDVMEYLNR
jgi:hypothetical protein